MSLASVLYWHFTLRFVSHALNGSLSYTSYSDLDDLHEYLYRHDSVYPCTTSFLYSPSVVLRFVCLIWFCFEHPYTIVLKEMGDFVFGPSLKERRLFVYRMVELISLVTSAMIEPHLNV